MGTVDQVINVSDLDRVFKEEVEHVFGYVLRRCGCRALAEDITGDTFVAAASVFKNGKGAQVTRPWLFNVAYCRLVDHWRSGGREKRRFGRLVNESAVRREPVDGDPDSRVEVAFSRLQHNYRVVLVMKYMEGFSQREIAEKLGVTEKTVEGRLTRARKKFGEIYKGLS